MDRSPVVAVAQRRGKLRDHQHRTDAELIACITRHDSDAFEVLYERHSGAAFSLALRMCGDRQAAEDVCQAAFFALWRRAASFDAGVGAVRGWLLTIVHHRAIDHLRVVARVRSRTSHDDASVGGLTSGDDTERVVLDRLDGAETATLVSRLSDPQRVAIELAFYSGYSHGEVAQQLNLPLGTVKSRIRMGLASLRHELLAAG